MLAHCSAASVCSIRSVCVGDWLTACDLTNKKEGTAAMFPLHNQWSYRERDDSEYVCVCVCVCVCVRACGCVHAADSLYMQRQSKTGKRRKSGAKHEWEIMIMKYKETRRRQRAQLSCVRRHVPAHTHKHTQTTAGSVTAMYDVAQVGQFLTVQCVVRRDTFLGREDAKMKVTEVAWCQRQWSQTLHCIARVCVCVWRVWLCRTFRIYRNGHELYALKCWSCHREEEEMCPLNKMIRLQKNSVSLFVVLFQTSELLPTDLIGSVFDNVETVSEGLV